MKVRALALGKAQSVIVHPTLKKRPMIKGWNKRELSYDGNLWKVATGFGIQTGKRTNLTVVDVDVPVRDWFNKFWAQSGLPYTMQVETPSGGCHLYYRYDKRLNQGQKKWGKTNLDIDVRNDGGHIMAPGSPYDSDKPEKMKYNGQMYKFATNEDGEELDWKFIRPLDEIWVHMQQHGIDLDTFEIGKESLKEVLKKPAVVIDDESSDDEVIKDNRYWFMQLMLEYGKTHTTEEEWKDGIWCIRPVAEENGWDGVKFAVEWSKQQPNYTGIEPVVQRYNYYDPKKGKKYHFGYNKIAGRLPPDNPIRKAFYENYCKKYYFMDAFKLQARGHVDHPEHKKDPLTIKEVRDFMKTALIRTNPRGNFNWFLRYKDVKNKLDEWRDGPRKLFAGNNRIGFSFYVPKTPEEIELEKDGDEKKVVDPLKKCQSSFEIQLEKYQAFVPCYEDIIFRPYCGDKPAYLDSYYNIFQGYEHTAMDKEEWESYYVGQIKKDYKQLKNFWRDCMCGGNQEVIEYVFNWLAYLLKHGSEKPRTALVFIGEQGAGKSMMIENFFRKGILGQRLCNVVTNIDRFCEKFNAERLYKKLHIFSECGSLRGKENSKRHDMMKAIITDSSFRCERKGKEATTEEDLAGCIFISNHDFCVKVENNDRRYVCPDFNSKEKKRSEAWWANMASIVGNPTIQRLFFTELVNRDLSKFQQSKIPHTETRKRLKETKNENLILEFLRNAVTVNSTNWYQPEDNCPHRGDGWYSVSAIATSFKSYCDNAMKFPKKCVFARHGWKSKQAYLNAIGDKEVRLMSYKVTKDTVKELHRAWLGDPDWDYPEIETVDAVVSDADKPPILEIRSL